MPCAEPVPALTASRKAGYSLPLLSADGELPAWARPRAALPPTVLPAFMAMRSIEQGEQPLDIQRAPGSGPFKFQHDFSRENPGRLEDYYLIGRRLGRGSFGSVHQVVCKQTGMQRAVKTIRLELADRRETLAQEISVAKQLDHPNIVRLFETWRDCTSIHLVMELCTGGELFDMIVNSNGFGEVQAATCIQQILAALCYLHSLRLVHRDVKPENFLLQSSAPGASLKMVDFGVARHFEPGQLMSSKVGTVSYAAPQVLEGAYDEKCDIWSAGVIAYILLCGYPPFDGTSDPQIIRRVCRGYYSFPEADWGQVSRDAKSLVVQMLTRDPESRPSAAELLALPLLQAHGLSRRAPLTVTSFDFVERLQSFQAESKLRKLALTAVAQQLPSEETEMLQGIFLSLDRNGDGVLSVQEVEEGLAEQGLRVPPAMEELLRSVDSDGSGTLDYSEFVAAVMDRSVCAQPALCKAAFRTLDLDGDGKISRDELDRVLNGGCPKAVHSASRITKMIDEADTNGDGCVDFDEFYCLMSRTKSEAMPGFGNPVIGDSRAWLAC